MKWVPELSPWPNSIVQLINWVIVLTSQTESVIWFLSQHMRVQVVVGCAIWFFLHGQFNFVKCRLYDRDLIWWAEFILFWIRRLKFECVFITLVLLCLVIDIWNFFRQMIQLLPETLLSLYFVPKSLFVKSEVCFEILLKLKPITLLCDVLQFSCTVSFWREGLSISNCISIHNSGRRPY